MYLWVADKFAQKIKSEKGNMGEEKTVVVEGRRKKKKRERERDYKGKKETRQDSKREKKRR